MQFSVLRLFRGSLAQHRISMIFFLVFFVSAPDIVRRRLLADYSARIVSLIAIALA
jgi:hypothetical protein